jgi:isoleucyl-tRNA synthetase
MISVIELGRQIREKNKIPIKKPVAYLEVINFDTKFIKNLEIVEQYILEELNANEIKFNNEERKLIKISAKPNFEFLYKACKDISQMMKDEEKEDDTILKKEEMKLKQEANILAKIIKTLSDEKLRELIQNKSIVVEDTLINSDMVIIEKKFNDAFLKDKEHVYLTNQDCGLRMNIVANEDLIKAFFAREVIIN